MSAIYSAKRAIPYPIGYKDPHAVLDYGFLWQDWLEPSESISSHTITADAGITVNSSAVNGSPMTIDGISHKAGSVITVWLSGGTDGTSYVVACRVSTTFGRTDERSMKISIKNR